MIGVHGKRGHYGGVLSFACTMFLFPVRRAPGFEKSCAVVDCVDDNPLSNGVLFGKCFQIQKGIMRNDNPKHC